MLKKTLRLSRQEIQFIMKNGKDFVSKLFIIKYFKNIKNFSQYCVIVSKKIAKKATKRNHLRRQIYESVRLAEKENAEINKKGFAIVLIPKRNIDKSSYNKMQEDISNFLPILEWKN
jgi:ribonuclease P protein component